MTEVVDGSHLGSIVEIVDGVVQAGAENGGGQPVEDNELIVPDEYATVESAFAAAQPGDTVYVRAGQWLQTGEIALPYGVDLRGDGPFATRIYRDGSADGKLLQYKGNNRISDLTLECEYGDPSAAAATALFNLVGDDGDLFVENCRLRANVDCVTFASGVTGSVYITNCTFFDYNWDGVAIFSDTCVAVIAGCAFTGTAQERTATNLNTRDANACVYAAAGTIYLNGNTVHRTANITDKGDANFNMIGNGWVKLLNDATVYSVGNSGILDSPNGCSAVWTGPTGTYSGNFKVYSTNDSIQARGWAGFDIDMNGEEPPGTFEFTNTKLSVARGVTQNYLMNNITADYMEMSVGFVPDNVLDTFVIPWPGRVAGTNVKYIHQLTPVNAKSADENPSIIYNDGSNFAIHFSSKPGSARRDFLVRADSAVFNMTGASAWCVNGVLTLRAWQGTPGVNGWWQEWYFPLERYATPDDLATAIEAAVFYVPAITGTPYNIWVVDNGLQSGTYANEISNVETPQDAKDLDVNFLGDGMRYDCVIKAASVS